MGISDVQGQGSDPQEKEIYHLRRRVDALLGVINDQYTAMIDFCLTLPLGGRELMEQMLRKLAILHTDNSLTSPLFTGTYAHPASKMSAMEALSFVFKIHINERIMERDWVDIEGTDDEFSVSYRKADCVYQPHCDTLVCNGFDCVCVRRFFYEGIVKGLTGETFQSEILTPRMDQEFCRFTFRRHDELADEEERVRTEISRTLEENIELRDLVRARTARLEEQNQNLINEIAERKKAEEHIRTLSQAIEQSPVSVILTNLKGDIVYVNGTFEKNTGYTSEEVLGQNASMLNSGHTSKEIFKSLWDTVNAGDTWEGEFQSQRKNGEVYWDKACISPVYDEEGKLQYFLSVEEDITLRKQQEEHILYQAHYDALTNLPNRFLTLDRLSQLIHEARRSQELVAVLFLDLDDFKKINDTLGHDVGDKILIKASERLSSSLRDGDTVGRLGGDEFMVLLGGLTNSTDASNVAENILSRFRDPIKIDNRSLVLTVSVGIAVFPDDGNTASELLRNADSAMYHSKEQGRNTFSYFTGTMNEAALRRLALEEQLHGALGRNEFRLYYQPQVDIASGRIVGVEALLRWNNPVLGEVSPMEFIPVAEHTGLIVSIGRYVLREALGLPGKCGIPNDQDFTIAVNLSPRQFRDPELVQFITVELEQAGFDPRRLELEITEGVLLSGHKHVEGALSALNGLGISLALDDFGTGYSSLSYLRKYPFNVLKIDRTFVRDLTIDSSDLELVIAIISMAQGLGLKVIAEGIEIDAQLDILKEKGCDMAQGYLFGRPVPEGEILALLA